MNRRTFLSWILAPLVVPPLPKDWHARKTLCSATTEGPTGKRGPCGGDPNAYRDTVITQRWPIEQ